MTTPAFGGHGPADDSFDMSGWDAPEASETATSEMPDGYRPMRAALGPSIHVVARDADGHLWIRASAATAMMLAGMALFITPFLVFWWFTNQMVENERVTINEPVLIQRAPVDKK